MIKITGYKVIAHRDLDLFNKLAMELVAEGYEPHGKLQIDDGRWVQDFIRYEDECVEQNKPIT